jgi:hypothetical protein
MKNAILRFLVSRAGGIATPIIAAGVAWVVTQLAMWDADLATTIDQAAVTAFVWGLIMSAVNSATNKVQTDGVVAIQAVLNENPNHHKVLALDGLPLTNTFTEVRRAVAAK